MGLQDWETALIVTGSVIVAYGLISAIALRAPPLPWTRRRRRWPHHSKRIAHRGGCLLGPENTLYTFRKAAELGCVDMIELDVAETKDGVVIVAHDESLARTCGVPHAIADMNYAELPHLAKSIALHFPSPRCHEYVMPDAEWHSAGPQPHPTLREVFEALPSMLFHVDVKQLNNPSLARKTVGLIREFKREDRTIVGSTRIGNAKVLREMLLPSPEELSQPSSPCPAPGTDAARTPLTTTSQRGGAAWDGAGSSRDRELYTFSCMEDVVKVIVLYYTGLLPFVPLWFDVYDIPLAVKLLQERLNKPVVSWLLHTPKLYAHLRRRGITVFGFVVNCREDLEECREWPIDGVMSDDPEIFQHAPWLADGSRGSPLSRA